MNFYTQIFGACTDFGGLYGFLGLKIQQNWHVIKNCLKLNNNESKLWCFLVIFWGKNLFSTIFLDSWRHRGTAQGSFTTYGSICTRTKFWEKEDFCTDFWYLHRFFGPKIRTVNFLLPDNEFLHSDFWVWKSIQTLQVKIIYPSHIVTINV